MQAVEFWKAVTVDRVDLLHQILDVVLAADDFRRVEPALVAAFTTER